MYYDARSVDCQAQGKDASLEAPKQVRVRGLQDYLEVMSKAVFQSGMSWTVVEAKWPGIREAFQEFDPELVADLTPEDIDRLVADARVIRNRRKLEAIVGNARGLLELDEQAGGFAGFLRTQGGFEETVAALKREFAFLGESGCYYFLYVVGEPVPPHDEWMKQRAAAVKPRRRERSATRH